MKTIIVTHKAPMNESEVNMNDLDKITAASVDSIRLGTTLDFVEKRDELLEVVASKVRYGGELELLGTDVYDTARGLCFAELDLDGADKLLYNGRQSVDTLQNVVHSLQQLGFEIKIKRIHKYVYFVKCIRPARS
jgi:hypothetical protein